jgi:hypothetical protein
LSRVNFLTIKRGQRMRERRGGKEAPKLLTP